jgi:predicted ATPase/DNA-binding winged helix-turn-helix (wHTH) protein
MNEITCFEFADFRLFPGRRALFRNDTPVEIGSRALDVLLALVRRHGDIATKTAIMAEVWPGTIVEENNLTTQIATVRRILGDSGSDATGTRFIVTVPGRGYRFVAAVHAIGPAAPAAARPSAAERTNLPLHASSFIGRERELSDLRARLESRALVTLVGTGGVGKTRTALKLAEDVLARFSDGALLLELAPLAEDTLVAEALCRLLGAPSADNRSAQDVAIAMLREKAMLLVLDNCEHVLGATAALASAILRHCPRVRIVATSREALSIQGESVFLMPSLGVPAAGAALTAAAALRSDAVRLFAERAADALGSYTLTDEDAPAVATICRRLDGVPLATELAAARLRMLKPAEIAARLEDVFRLLTGGSRTALPRHQTLRATIDWSFSLLSGPEQIVLRRLSTFADGCTADSATEAAGGDGIDPDAVFDLVGALVAKSLLVADWGGLATRYRMLETTRQYAAEKLAAAGETDRHRHMAACMLAIFRKGEQDWPSRGTDEWVATYGPETENLRAAIDWALNGGDAALGVALVAHAGAIAEEMSLQPDLLRWTAAAMAQVTDDTPANEAAQLLYLRTMQQKRLGPTDIPADRMRAIALFRQTGDRVWLSRALRQTAIARAMPGAAVPELLSMLAEAVSLLRPLAPHKDLATALAHTGSVYFLYGDNETSRSFNEQALAMRQALGDRSGVMASAVNLAELLFLSGDAEAALAYATQAEAEARHRNAQGTLALILCNLAGYRLQGDDVTRGMQAASEALALSRAIGQDYLAVQCLEHLALGLGLSGDYVRAARLLGFTQAHYLSTGQTREHLEQAGYQQLAALLEHALPSTRLTTLYAQGATWNAEQADASLRTASHEAGVPA